MLKLRTEDLVYTLYYIPMAIVAPFISWYYFGLSKGEWIGTGLIIAIPYVTLIFSTRFFGALSDRIGSKKLINFSLITLSISYIIYFFIENNAFLFFLLYIGFNLLISAFMPSFNRHVSFQEGISRSESFGNLGTFASVGFLVGSFMTAILIESVGFRALFLLASLFSLIGLIFSTKLVEYKESSRGISLDINEVSASSSSDSKYSLKSIYILLILVVLTQMANSLLAGFFAIFVVSELAYSIGWIALLNTLATLFGAIAALLIGRQADRISRKLMLLVASFLYTLFPIITYIFSDPLTPWTFPLALAIYAFPLYAIFFVLIPVFISENTPNSHRGTIMGLYTSSQYLGQAIGIMLGAYLASINGIIRPNFLLSTFIGMVAIIICLIFFKE